MMDADVELERWVKQGREALLRDDPRGAMDPLKRALTIDPEHPEAHMLLARALLKLKRPDAALVEANAAILHAPESTYAHTLLGDILYANRDLVGAKRHYETARELDPHETGPLRGLASVAAFHDDDKGALDLLRQALELDPEDVSTMVDLASHHLELGRLGEAERWAKAALELEPTHRRALVVMGFVFLRHGNVAAAKDHAAWALRIDPTDVSALRLFSAVKARESLLLGTWYRANAAVAGLGPNATAALLAAFVGQLLLRLILEDLGLPAVAALLHLAWLGICYYSYIGPPMFRRMLQKELESVRLKTDF